MDILYPCNLYNGKCDNFIPKSHERCFQCHGTGCFPLSAHYKQRTVFIIVCPQCNGKGYIDWIKHARNVSISIAFHKKREYISFKCKGDRHCKTIKRWLKKEYTIKEHIINEYKT